MRILKNEVFSKEYGFIVDYLAEILRDLRKTDYSGLLDKYVELHNSLSARDKTAIRKSFSGMAKLMYPHKEMNEEQVLELLNFAVEGRKRVKDQLYILDETFRNEPVEFTYVVKSSGKVYAPETLEKLNYAIAKADREVVEEQEEAMTVVGGMSTIKLEPHQTLIYDNQTGVSYKKLFADYLKGATRISIQDPYIRLPYQFKNLLEFCLMLSQNKDPEEEIHLEVITWNSSEYQAASVAYLEEFQESMLGLGIHFTYILQDVHDRFIWANNGWKITLGRGLDIFEKTEGRFNAADLDQGLRRCKACEVTYIRV